MSLAADAIQAHIKSVLVGASVTIPIKDGKLVSSVSALRFSYRESSQLNILGPRNMAGRISARVSRRSAPAPSRGYYSRGESVMSTCLDFFNRYSWPQ